MIRFFFGTLAVCLTIGYLLVVTHQLTFLVDLSKVNSELRVGWTAFSLFVSLVVAILSPLHKDGNL